MPQNGASRQEVPQYQYQYQVHSTRYKAKGVSASWLHSALGVHAHTLKL